MVTLKQLNLTVIIALVSLPLPLTCFSASCAEGFPGCCQPPYCMNIDDNPDTGSTTSCATLTADNCATCTGGQAVWVAGPICGHTKGICFNPWTVPLSAKLNAPNFTAATTQQQQLYIGALCYSLADTSEGKIVSDIFSDKLCSYLYSDFDAGEVVCDVIKTQMINTH